MTPTEVRAARARLGEMWDLGGDLTYGELARCLEMHGPRAGSRSTYTDRGRDLERHGANGPQSVAIRAMLEGFFPEGAPPDAQRPDAERPLVA